MKVKRTGPKPDSDLTKHRGIEQVRQVQHLMLLCSLLPPDGKMQEVLRLALSVREEPLLAHITPVKDLHPRTTKSWFESFWLRADMSDEEEELVAWQNEKGNIDAAVEELKNVERQIGIRLASEKIE
jgi:hypothetical protein